VSAGCQRGLCGDRASLRPRPTETHDKDGTVAIAMNFPQMFPQYDKN